MSFCFIFPLQLPCFLFFSFIPFSTPSTTIYNNNIFCILHSCSLADNIVYFGSFGIHGRTKEGLVG